MIGTQIKPMGWKAISTSEIGKLRVLVNDTDTEPLRFQYKNGGDGVTYSGDVASGYTISLNKPQTNQGVLLAICDRGNAEDAVSVADAMGVVAYEPLAPQIKNCARWQQRTELQRAGAVNRPKPNLRASSGQLGRGVFAHTRFQPVGCQWRWFGRTPHNRLQQRDARRVAILFGQHAIRPRATQRSLHFCNSRHN